MWQKPARWERMPENGEISKMGHTGSGDSGKYFSGKRRKIVKLEKKRPRNCSGWKSDRNPPPLGTEGQKMAEFQNGDHRKWWFRKILSKKSQNRKIGKEISFVILAAENLTEIRPLWVDAQKWQNSKKMGIIGSGDSGKYFPKVAK